MTVRELIEKLKDMPQDYVVEVYRYDGFEGKEWTDELCGDVEVWDAEHGVVCIS